MLPGLPRGRLAALYRRMPPSRRFEEGAISLARAVHSCGQVHLRTGQETIVVPAPSQIAPNGHIAAAHPHSEHLPPAGDDPGRLVANFPQPARDAAAVVKRGRPDLWGPDRGSERTPVDDGSLLAVGHVLAGPAVIEERTTTVVVPASFTCCVDPWRDTS